MSSWAEYTTGERVKVLRGPMSQHALSEAADVSIALVQKLEQNRGHVSLAYLMKISEALGTDLSVVLGEQAPRASMDRDERAGLRAIAAAVHGTAMGEIGGVEAPTLGDAQTALDQVFADYWSGRYDALGVTLPKLLWESRALYDSCNIDERFAAGGIMSDAYQLAGHYANNHGLRDLAYAATSYGKGVAGDIGDELRVARWASVLSWVFLRDGKPKNAMRAAEKAAMAIEPRFSEADDTRIAVYGNLMTNAAVAASRGGATPDRARDFISQAHAAAARMSGNGDVIPFGAIFGKPAATTQAVSVALALGDVGRALTLIDGTRLREDLMQPSSVARYRLDIALAKTEVRQWDAAIEALDDALRIAPAFTRSQALSGVLVNRLGDAKAAKVRKLARQIGVPLRLA